MANINKELKQFVKTSNATVKVVVCLINDLAPIIGFREAKRLLNFYHEAQKDEEE